MDELTFIDDKGAEYPLCGEIVSFKPRRVRGRVKGTLRFKVHQMSDAAAQIIPNWSQHKSACAWLLKVRTAGQGPLPELVFYLRNLNTTRFSYADGPPIEFTLGFETDWVNPDPADVLKAMGVIPAESVRGDQG